MDGFTIGVEEEYQLVDTATGALRNRARNVMRLDWSDDLRPELHESMLETSTRICRSAAELESEIERLRVQVATAAAADGLRIVAAGTHPFSAWVNQRRTAGERYRRIERRYARIAWDELNFGLHVHVGIPPTEDRVRIMDRVRPYLPHLLALSCSSPYHEGGDTGYDSFRMILWRRWPFAGIPPRFGSAAAYDRFLRRLLDAAMIEDGRNIYFSVRPHPVYPTLEFRVTDVCPRIDDTVAIAALVRALVITAAQDRLPVVSRAVASATTEHVLLSRNEWAAARAGLAATISDPTGGWGPTPIRDAIHRLLDCVFPAGAAAGDAAALGRVPTLLARGNGAQRMRRVYAQCGGYKPLLDWLAGETLLGTGTDRRRAQREECA